MDHEFADEQLRIEHAIDTGCGNEPHGHGEEDEGQCGDHERATGGDTEQPHQAEQEDREEQVEPLLDHEGPRLPEEGIDRLVQVLQEGEVVQRAVVEHSARKSEGQQHDVDDQEQVVVRQRAQPAALTEVEQSSWTWRSAGGVAQQNATDQVAAQHEEQINAIHEREPGKARPMLPQHVVAVHQHHQHNGQRAHHIEAEDPALLADHTAMKVAGRLLSGHGRPWSTLAHSY